MYRILPPTAMLGYGFPQKSFERAMEMDLNSIAVDAHVPLKGEECWVIIPAFQILSLCHSAKILLKRLLAT